MDEELYVLAERVGAALRAADLMLASAESCTGGWVSQVVTMVPGSSNWFERGFVTYTNEAKQEMLGVRAQTLEREGAVSEATVREMAEGALRQSHAEVSVAISGIAGPGGAVVGKPVGTVCLAWADARSPTEAETRHFDGDRAGVRRQAVIAALDGVIRRVHAVGSPMDTEERS